MRRDEGGGIGPDIQPAAVILISTSLSFNSELDGIGKVILVNGLPSSVRARAFWVDIVGGEYDRSL